MRTAGYLIFDLDIEKTWVNAKSVHCLYSGVARRSTLVGLALGIGLVLVYLYLVLAKPRLVPLGQVNKRANHDALQKAYENKTAHHVHAAANAGVESDLVGGNHPLAAGLCEQTVSVLPIRFLNFLTRAQMCSLLRWPPLSLSAHVISLDHPTSFPSSSNTETTYLLPCPQAIVLLELALVVRYTVLAEDPAGASSVLSCVRKAGCVQCESSRDEEHHVIGLEAARGTYPAIVKSGDVFGVVRGCNGWFGSCVGREVDVE
jgi:hypothetical protein